MKHHFYCAELSVCKKCKILLYYCTFLYFIRGLSLTIWFSSFVVSSVPGAEVCQQGDYSCYQYAPEYQ